MAESNEAPPGPIINELLCFTVNKIDKLDHETLIKLCTEKYSEKEIENSKDLLFSMLHNAGDFTTLVKRRSSKVSESKSVKGLRDIYQLLQEKGTDELPPFVALNLGNLPPITFDHIDVTVLLNEIENVRNKVDVMHSVIQKQNEVSNLLTLSNNELKRRVESIEENKGSEVDNIPKGKNVEPKSVNEPNFSLILFQCTECGFECATSHELAKHVEVCKNRN